MYYLRLENNGDNRAIYKARKFARYYRGEFVDMDYKYSGMKLYTTSQLEKIMDVRLDVYHHCVEWFDVYDENGKVDMPKQWLYKALSHRTLYLVDGVVQEQNPKQEHPWYIAGVDYTVIKRGSVFKLYKYNDWFNTDDEPEKFVLVNKNGVYIVFETKEQLFECEYFS